MYDQKLEGEKAWERQNNLQEVKTSCFFSQISLHGDSDCSDTEETTDEEVSCSVHKKTRNINLLDEDKKITKE